MLDLAHYVAVSFRAKIDILWRVIQVDTDTSQDFIRGLPHRGKASWVKQGEDFGCTSTRLGRHILSIFSISETGESSKSAREKSTAPKGIDMPPRTDPQQWRLSIMPPAQESGLKTTS